MAENLSRQELRRLERERAKALIRQPHVQDQLKKAAAGAFPRGTVTIMNIYHDDGCPALTGGICRCEPDIKYEPWPAE